MTLETFLKELRKTPRVWDLREDRIRALADFRCPLEKVYALPIVLPSTRIPGLTRSLVVRIIAAADNCPSHDPRLRARLLRACGLTAGLRRPKGGRA